MDLKKIVKTLILLLAFLGLPSLVVANWEPGLELNHRWDFLSDYFTYFPIVGGSSDSVPPPVTSTPISPLPTLTVTPNPTLINTPRPSTTVPSPPEGMIYVDHNSVSLFDEIPLEYLEAARDLKMMYSDRSVGYNISEALNCLSASSWTVSPSHCREDYYGIEGSTWLYTGFGEEDYNLGLVPDRILFEPDPTLYSRANWIFEYRQGTWRELVIDFLFDLAPIYIDQVDVLSFQFSYLNVMDGDDIADPDNGFFADDPTQYDIHDIEAYMAQHPDKIFFYWTSSLARAIGSQVSMDFNNMMREYAIENNKILFDVADIEAHTDAGEACFDNRDGVEVCTPNAGCENNLDDGLDIPAICQDWTTEITGGHLGAVSGGQIQIAKAFWVLMAQIAGWDPTQ